MVPDPPATAREAEIEEYLRGITPLPAEPAKVELGAPSPASRDGDYSCTTHDVSETRQVDQVVVYASASDGIWAGALVRGDGLANGIVTPISLARAPQTISVSLPQTAGPKSARLVEPTLSSYREALSKILAAEVTGSTPANLTWEIEQVHSSEQLALALGASASWPGAGDITGSFDFARQDIRSRYVIRFAQSYFTVDVDPPSRPSLLFGADVDARAIARASAGAPVLYVASVTYGRLVVFVVESTYSAEELEAALRFALSTRGATPDVSGSTAASYSEVLSRSKMSARILGGNGGEAVEAIGGYEELIDFLRQGGNFSASSPGSPIAYRLAYAGDNSLARFSFTDAYVVRECDRVSQGVRVTLKQLRVDSAGGDVGGDLEIFGDIFAVGTPPLVLLERGPSEFLRIAEGSAWPADVSQAPSRVVPVTAGSALELSLTLSDTDGSIGVDDLIGARREVIPAVDGWRRDLTVTLTGSNSSVLVTFGLEPL